MNRIKYINSDKILMVICLNYGGPHISRIIKLLFKSFARELILWLPALLWLCESNEFGYAKSLFFLLYCNEIYKITKMKNCEQGNSMRIHIFLNFFSAHSLYSIQTIRFIFFFFISQFSKRTKTTPNKRQPNIIIHHFWIVIWWRLWR